MFVLLCVDPHDTGLLSRLAFFIYYTIPHKSKKLGVRLFGERITSNISYYALYIFRKPNPFFQIVYLALSLGGYFIYTVEGFPMLPNKFAAGYHIYTGSIVYFMALATYIFACLVPPGNITSANCQKWIELHPYDNLYYKPVDCSTCKRPKPARSKHCSVCDKCIPRQDHHCIWINQCVGHQNYKYFIAFLFSHAIICLYGAHIAFACLASFVVEHNLLYVTFTTRSGERVESSVTIVMQYLLQQYTAFVFVFVLCLMVGIVLLGFWAYHMWLTYKNNTTNERCKRSDKEYEYMKNQDEEYIQRFRQNLYDKGTLENFKEVLFA